MEVPLLAAHGSGHRDEESTEPSTTTIGDNDATSPGRSGGSTNPFAEDGGAEVDIQNYNRNEGLHCEGDSQRWETQESASSSTSNSTRRQADASFRESAEHQGALGEPNIHVPLLARELEVAESGYDRSRQVNRQCINSRFQVPAQMRNGHFTIKRWRALLLATLMLLVIYLVILGFYGLQLYEKCVASSSPCYKLDKIFVPDLCGKNAESEAGFDDLPFNVQVTFDLPFGGWWPSLYLDDIHVHAFTPDDELILRTTLMTPVSTYGDGHTASRYLAFGHSKLHLENSSILLASNTTGSKRLADALWRTVNRLEGPVLKVETRATVTTRAFGIPISKELVLHSNYRCYPETDYHDGYCAFEGSKFDSSSMINFTTRSVHFEDVHNALSELEASAVVNVDLPAQIPVVYTKVPSISQIDIYVSETELWPTMEELHQPHSNATHIVNTSVAAFSTDQNFNIKGSGFIHVDGPGETLNALRRSAKLLVPARAGHPLYVYAKLHRVKVATFCVANKVIDALEAFRMEVTASLLEDKSNNSENQSMLRKVEIGKTTSSAYGGSVGLLAEVSLPMQITGTIPEVDFSIFADENLLIQTNAHLHPTTGDDFEALGKVELNASLLNADLLVTNLRQQPQTVSARGLNSTNISLASSILADVYFQLWNASQDVAGYTVAKPKPEATIGVRSDTESVSTAVSMWFAKGEEPSFDVRFHSCYTNLSHPIRLIANDDTKNLEIVGSMQGFAFGPNERNNASVTASWSARDSGEALAQLILAAEQNATVSLKLLKEDCIDIHIRDIPHFVTATRSTGTLPTIVLNSIASYPKGASFGVQCALTGYPCTNPSGASVNVTLDPIVFGESKPLPIKMEEFPDLILSIEDGAARAELPFDNFLSFDWDGSISFKSMLKVSLADAKSSYKLLSTNMSEWSLKGEGNLLSVASARVALIQLQKSLSLVPTTLPTSWIADAAKLVLISNNEKFGVNASATRSHPQEGRIHAQWNTGPEEKPYLVVPSFNAYAKALDGKPLFELQSSDTGVRMGKFGLLKDTWFSIETSRSWKVDSQAFWAGFFRQNAAVLVTIVNSRKHQLVLNLSLDISWKQISSRRNLYLSPDSSPGNDISIELVNGRESWHSSRSKNVDLPCVFPVLCRDKVVDSYTTVYDFMVYFNIQSLRTNGLVRDAFMMSVPSISALVYSYVHGELFRAVMEAVNVEVSLSKNEDRLAFPVALELKSVQLLADVTRDVLASVHQMNFTLKFPEDGESLFPEVLSTSHIGTTIEPTSPDGLPMPVPKEDQWWFPLASVGSWSLVQSSANTAHFNVVMALKNPTPVTLIVRSVNGDAFLLRNEEKVWLGKVDLAEHDDLVIPANSLVKVAAALFVEGNMTDTAAKRFCSTASASRQSTMENCAIGTTLEQVINKQETQLLIQARVTNPLGELLHLNLKCVLLEGAKGGPSGEYVPPPRYAVDLPAPARVSPVNEFATIFKTVQVDGWSTAWRTLVKDGVNLALKVLLHNPFAFPIQVNRVKMSFSYDDPTGEYLNYLPYSFTPAYDIQVVHDLTINNLGISMQPLLDDSTPTEYVRLNRSKSEDACRLYNAAEKVLNLCASIPSGVVDIAVGDFKLTQGFSIYNVSVVGDNACITRPWCQPVHDVVPPEADNLTWSPVRSAKVYSSGALVLTQGSSNHERGAAWVNRRLPIRDGFTAEFEFVIRDTGWLGGGDGFAFVVRRDGNLDTIGDRCDDNPCNAYEGIKGPSVGIILYRSFLGNIEIHGVANGDQTHRIGFGNPPFLATLNDEKVHTMKVLYSRNDRKLYVFVDSHWVANFAVWEPAEADTGPCSPGHPSPTRALCVDMDKIGGDDGFAWVGLTASTGIAMRSVHEFPSFNFHTPQISSGETLLLEDKRVVGVVGIPSDFRIDLRDSCGAPIRRVAQTSLLVVLHFKGQSSAIAATILSGRSTGVLHCQFLPPSAGEYTVMVEGSVIGSVRVVSEA